MAQVKVLARNWGLYVFDQAATDAGTGEDIYQKIHGVTTFGIEPDMEQADTTDFDSSGFSEHLPSSRSSSISLEGQYKEDDTDGTQDPGQKILDDLAEKVGTAAITRFRIKSPGGTVKEYNVSVTPGTTGGGVSDPTSWGATLNVSGKPSTVDTSSDSATYNE